MKKMDSSKNHFIWGATTMLSKAKKLTSVIITAVIICGIFIVAPVIASLPLTDTSDTALLAAESPFTTYTIVDPGNGENGTTVLTWDQISGNTSIRTLRINIGSTVNIRATTSPTARTTINFYTGYDRKKGDPLIQYPCTITGVPGITYESLAIATFGDTVIQDLSFISTFGTAFSIGRVSDIYSPPEAWFASNYYYRNYDATLTVIGNCTFEAAYGPSRYTGLQVPLFSVKEFTIDGPGTLTVKGGHPAMLYAYGEGNESRREKAILTVNIPLFIEDTSTSDTLTSALQIGEPQISASWLSEYEVKGAGSITAISTGLQGSGIRYGGSKLTFNGDLRLHAKGKNINNDYGFYWDHATGDLVFNLSHNAVFEGGDRGAGIAFFPAYTESQQVLNITNKGTGSVVFRGGAIRGDGIRIWSNPCTVALSNTGIGRFLVNGCGQGSGLLMSRDHTFDISGLNYDLELIGGEAAPSRQMLSEYGGYPTLDCSAGLALEIATNTVKLGNNNLLCQGGANGGAGMDLIRASSLTVESTGGQIYAIGGKGSFGYGLHVAQSTMAINGGGTINAYGGYDNAGVMIGTNGNGTITLSGGTTINALGGAKAPDVRGTIR